MASDIVVRQVTGKQDWRTFIEFPWKVYANDPVWVPPLLSTRKEKFDPRKNPALAHLDTAYFVAWRGEAAVGVISAFINHHHNDYHHENIGWFGFFEVLEDAQAAHALLETAADWCRNRGVSAMRGPASFTDLDEFGLQVDGFGKPHYMVMPHNPAYYVDFIESAGFEAAMGMYTGIIDAEAFDMDRTPPKVHRVIEKQKKRRKIVLRKPDMKNLEHEVELMEQMYIEGWKDNWGFIPPTHEEMWHLVSQMKIFFDPDLARIAEVNGEVAGFILIIPDINQAMHYAYPNPREPEPLTLLKLLWHWKLRRKIDRVRVPFLTVLEKYRNMAIETMLFMDVATETLAKGYTSGHIGWVLENNDEMSKLGEMMSVEVFKRFRLYEKIF